MLGRSVARHLLAGRSASARPHANTERCLVKHYRIPQGHSRYQGYGSRQNLLSRWAQSPTFYYQVTGITVAGGGFYTYNLEPVPVSGRKRFNIVAPKYEKVIGDQMYRDTLSAYEGNILPSSHPQHRMVERVLKRLIPHADLPPEDQDWEVHVIRSPETNAFVMPGGKVFVFSHMLELCQDEDGLAAVLGHEIAHNVAHHSAEKMSRNMLFMPVALGASLLLGLQDTSLSQMAIDVGLVKPNGRAQESEADYIGLLMMARACYNPAAAVGIWERFAKLEETTGAPPQFLSTHPSSSSRKEKIQQWLPEAIKIQEEDSECKSTIGHALGFQKAVGSQQWMR